MGRLLGSALLAVLIIACGGEGAATRATTTVAPETTASTPTTAPPQTTSTSVPSTTITVIPTTTSTPSGDFGDIPQECIDAFTGFFINIEDVVAGYDFENAGLHEFEALTIGLIPAATALYEEIQNTVCLEFDGSFPDSIYPALVDFAKREAPGSIGYLVVQQAMSEMPLGESCQTDIEALQSYVDAGGIVSDLSAAERFHAFSLVGSINSWCGLLTAGEYTNRDEVIAFLEIG